MATSHVNPGATLEQRLTPSFSLTQQVTDQIFQSMRVALPAIVQEFKPGPPATVTVLFATAELVSRNIGGPGLIDLAALVTNLPLLEFPIGIQTGGGYSFTVPIKPGDECLIVFNDVPIWLWLQNGGINNQPYDQRRHSIADGIAWFGLRSTPRGISNYSTTSAQIRSDDQQVMIDLAAAGITMTAPKLTINTTGDMDINAGGNVNINGNNIDLSGSSATVIQSHNFINHLHKGVTPGSGDSGPVL